MMVSPKERVELKKNKINLCRALLTGNEPVFPQEIGPPFMLVMVMKQPDCVLFLPISSLSEHDSVMGGADPVSPLCQSTLPVQSRVDMFMSL